MQGAIVLYTLCFHCFHMTRPSVFKFKHILLFLEIFGTRREIDSFSFPSLVKETKWWLNVYFTSQIRQVLEGDFGFPSALPLWWVILVKIWVKILLCTEWLGKGYGIEWNRDQSTLLVILWTQPTSCPACYFMGIYSELLSPCLPSP